MSKYTMPYVYHVQAKAQVYMCAWYRCSLGSSPTSCMLLVQSRATVHMVFCKGAATRNGKMPAQIQKHNLFMVGCRPCCCLPGCVSRPLRLPAPELASASVSPSAAPAVQEAVAEFVNSGCKEANVVPVAQGGSVWELLNHLQMVCRSAD